MKITKEQLIKMIQEELSETLQEEADGTGDQGAPNRRHLQGIAGGKTCRRQGAPLRGGLSPLAGREANGGPAAW